MALVEDTSRRSWKAKHFYDATIGKWMAELTISDRHYHDGSAWQDVDESLIDDGADGFTKKSDKTRHTIRFGNAGERRWYPRRNVSTEYVGITNIQYWRTTGGGSWRNLNLPTPVWRAQGAEWDLPNLYASITNIWRGVKSDFILKDNTAPTRLRFAVEFVGLTYNATTGELTSTIDGLVWGYITPPKAWYGNPRPDRGVPLPITATYDGEYIEWSVDTTGAIFPVYVDPTLNQDADTNDGYIDGANATYATARSTAHFSYANETYLMVGNTLYGGTYYIMRGFLKFDTSSIPDGAAIDQVNISMVVTVDDSAEDFDVQIVKQNWSAQDPLGSGGDEAAYDNCLAGTADDNIWRNTNGMSVNTVYTSGNLSTAWINKTGYTYYSLRSSEDYNNSAPTGLEEITLASADHATASYRPELVVVYTEAGGDLTINVSDGLTVGESRTITVSGPQVNITDSLTLGDSVTDLDIVGGEGETLSISVTPDNSAYQVQGIRIVG